MNSRAGLGGRAPVAMKEFAAGRAEVSQHYQGRKGSEYVHHLADAMSPGYALNFRYFRPYLNRSQLCLDFGCGNGGMLRLVREHVARADGLEVNPAAAAIAVEAAGGGTIYHSIDELPPGPTYDVVVSNSVLEHVRDVCGTLEVLRTHIKPGGLLIAKVPFDDANARYQRRWSRDDVDHHLHTWTPRLFANLLYECGYEVQECRMSTSAWHPRLFWLMKYGLGPLAFWALSVVKRRRVLLGVATVPK